MSFSRKWLRDNGVPEEFHDLLIDKSQSTETPLRQQRDEAIEKAEAIPELKHKLEETSKQLEEAQKAAASDQTGARLKAVQDEFAAYKADVEKRESAATAERLLREQLKAAKLDDRYADLAVKDMNPSQYAVKDGAFEDAEAVGKAVAAFAEKYPQFVMTTNIQGASTGNPPAKSGGQAEPSSLADALRQRYSEKG